MASRRAWFSGTVFHGEGEGMKQSELTLSSAVDVCVSPVKHLTTCV